MVKQNVVNRPPIVAILGHVDHGKTSLLDRIRAAHVADREIGGITQSIGAYQAEFQGKKITFIDTPGHAAFSAMRSRGAKVADLIVLVVAADDGVKPQTIESVKHIKESGVPFVVAINKIDKVGASAETAKAQLTEHEVYVEGYGGNTPTVSLSARTGEGVESLLENLLILADLEELGYDELGSLEAPIIEAKKDMKRGVLVSSIVKRGTLNVGDLITSGSTNAKIRALFNHQGLSIKKALPGEPVQVLGFSSLPSIGEVLRPESGKETPRVENLAESEPAAVNQVATDKLNLILKASTQGSLEAITSSLTEDVNIISMGTGDISESDVLLASTTNSIVIGFDVKLPASSKKLSEIEGVRVKNFRIIYELLEYIEKKVMRLLEPTIDEEELGRATIIKIFEINDDKIAGITVTSGTLTQGDQVHITRKDGESKNARIKSIRIGKQEVKKVESGKECGILFFPKLDLREKDNIISYKKIKTDED